MACNPGVTHHEWDELLGGSVFPGGGDRWSADKACRLLATPPETSLDRGALLIHVVAVEVEANLEPQRVTGSEAAGHRALLYQCVPYLHGAGGVDEQLEAVLAGVPG